jgi:uncharacterized protein (TIGR04255 family)
MTGLGPTHREIDRSIRRQGIAMGFPEAPRVFYENNPLDEVVCQLRFPPILKIEAEIPSVFQEQIRTTFPLYENKPASSVLAGLPAALASALLQEFPLGTGRTAHEFTTSDRQWTLSLTRDFIALTCRQYRRWEDFKDHLQPALQSLLELYAPAFYSRVGLRYVDVIRRSTLGLDGVGWGELLQPWIAGPFAEPGISPNVDNAATDLLIGLPQLGANVRVRHGLVLHQENQEPSYLIDADIFDESQVGPTDVFSKLNLLNRQAGLLFRWCIRQRLHDAMHPQPLN